MKSKSQASTTLKTSQKTPNGRKVTMSDVAQAAGVGLTTVSYALTGKGNLPESTREAVIRAAAELGYESNYFAQNLKMPYRDVVALCIGVDLGINTLTIWDLQGQLDKRGYTLEVHTTPVFVSQSARKQAELLRLVRRQKPRALVCETSGLDQAGLDELQIFIKQGGLLVCFANSNAPDLDCDCVVYDDEDSAYQAANHLLKQGHHALGLSIHHDECSAEHPHVRGFTRALSEANLKPNPAWMWANCCYEDAGACMARKFLALPVSKRPTGICIINDVSAASFVNHVSRAGLRVPQDISVVGHDDTPGAQHCLVPLTTISHSAPIMASHMIELLLSRMEGHYDGPVRTITVRGEIVERESVLLRRPA